MLDIGPARPGNCVVETDFPAGALGAGLGEEPADIDRHMLGIADEVVANPISSLRCLGKQMQPIGLAERIAVKGITRERAQDHQRRHPLPVWRAFIDLVASIRGVDRLNPVRALGGKIRFLVQSTHRFEAAEDVLLEAMDLLTGWASPHMKL